MTFNSVLCVAFVAVMATAAVLGLLFFILFWVYSHKYGKTRSDSDKKKRRIYHAAWFISAMISLACDCLYHFVLIK